MEPTYLTLAEAAAKTGRSASTVRRVIHGIVSESAHPDRSGIEPTAPEVAAFKKKGENFTWKIREDLLQKYFAGAQPKEKKSASEGKSDVLQILHRELEIKNQQIERQWDVIQSLNERLREGNILMGSLQKRLALPEGTSSPSMQPSVVEASSPDPSAEPSADLAKKAFEEVSKKASMKAAKKSSAKERSVRNEQEASAEQATVVASGQASKGWFGWLRK